jgi:hypothetical protein
VGYLSVHAGLALVPEEESDSHVTSADFEPAAKKCTNSGVEEVKIIIRMLVSEFDMSCLS